jgi:hypothetical protein
MGGSSIGLLKFSYSPSPKIPFYSENFLRGSTDFDLFILGRHREIGLSSYEFFTNLFIFLANYY